MLLTSTNVPGHLAGWQVIRYLGKGRSILQDDRRSMAGTTPRRRCLFSLTAFVPSDFATTDSVSRVSHTSCERSLPYACMCFVIGKGGGEI